MASQNPKVISIVPAAGWGRRMRHQIPKQFINIGKRPLFIYCLEKMDLCSVVDGVILVVPEAYLKRAQGMVGRWHIQKVIAVIRGGEERQNSVYNAIQVLPQTTEIVIVHDAVRPFISAKKIEEVVLAARKWGAAVLGMPEKCTVKRVEDRWVQETLKRDEIWEIQTPQAFRVDWIKDAYNNAIKNNSLSTDDAALVEQLGHAVRLVEGEENNIKVTSQEDLLFANFILTKGPS